MTKVLQAPGLDPNIGAYEYGWHGSYTRMSNLFKCTEIISTDGKWTIGPHHNLERLTPSNRWT
jgi:hypothetical protein